MVLLHALARFDRALLPKLNVVDRLQQIPVDRYELVVDLENSVFPCRENLKKVENLGMKVHL